MRPSSIRDTVHDFGPNGDIPLYLTVNSNSFTNLYYTFSSAIAHKISIGSPAVPKLQNKDGQDSPPASSEIILVYQQGNLNVPVTIKEVNNNTSKNFLVRVDSPNRWLSEFQMYSAGTIPGAPSIYILPNNRPNYESFYFKVFQKSIAIIEDITTVPTVVNGQTKVIVTNDIIRVQKTKSRGKNFSSSWFVQVRDSSNNFVTAVQGTDYQFVSGNSNTDIVEIKVLQSKLYRIICTINGFTSSNNNFPGTGTGDVSTNTDTAFYLLDVTPLGVDNQDIINLPKINAVVNIQNQTSNVPNQTGYASSFVSVNGTVDTNSASYVIKDLNSGSQTIVDLNLEQWTEELLTRTDIVLEIKNKSTNEVVITKTGLGPHENIILPIGNFIVQYKTTLK